MRAGAVAERRRFTASGLGGGNIAAARVAAAGPQPPVMAAANGHAIQRAVGQQQRHHTGSVRIMGGTRSRACFIVLCACRKLCCIMYYVFLNGMHVLCFSEEKTWMMN